LRIFRASRRRVLNQCCRSGHLKNLFQQTASVVFRSQNCRQRAAPPCPRPCTYIARQQAQLHDPQRRDCLAGHVGLELRNVVTNYPVESSIDFRESSSAGFGWWRRHVAPARLRGVLACPSANVGEPPRRRLHAKWWEDSNSGIGPHRPC